MRPNGPRIEFYQDVSKRWRWTQYAMDHTIRISSESSFPTRHDAWTNWRTVLIEACTINEDGAMYIRDDRGVRHRAR